MDLLTEKLRLIKLKVQRVVEQNQALSREVEELKTKVKELEKTAEIQKNTIQDIEEQNKMIKLAKNFTLQGKDSFDVKIKINELVREIDRCIDLLNE